MKSKILAERENT